MIDLSIILPTCNRAPLLKNAIRSIALATSSRYELVVVDGASADHTPAVVEAAAANLGDRLRYIREEQREGFVRAANKGFRAARGRWMCWLNDDARPHTGSLDLAIAQLDSSDPGVGLVGLFHAWGATRNVAYESQIGKQIYRLCHVRGTLYANFAVGLRTTFERLNGFDERYFLYGADPDLSLKAWHAGLRVEPAWGTAVDHDEHHDDRRTTDTSVGESDNRKLFEKWDLPMKNPLFNDFDPSRPCTLHGLNLVHGIKRSAA